MFQDGRYIEQTCQTKAEQEQGIHGQRQQVNEEHQFECSLLLLWFQVYLTSFRAVFSPFPHGTFALSGLTDI